MDRVTAILAVAVVLILRANILLAVEPISEFIEVEIGATYEAGEDDSKNDALDKAKAKAQREAAEEIVGVFLQGFTEVAGYQAVKDSISMFSQALLRSKTLEKNYECAPNCVATVKLRVKVKRSELRKFEAIVDRLRKIVLIDRIEKLETLSNHLVVVKSVDGNYVSDSLKPLQSELKRYETVPAKDIDNQKISKLGELFQVNSNNINAIRWGTSMAPKGHRLNGATWYTIWHGAANSNETVRVSRSGEVIEKITWVRPADRLVVENEGT